MDSSCCVPLFVIRFNRDELWGACFPLGNLPHEALMMIWAVNLNLNPRSKLRAFPTCDLAHEGQIGWMIGARRAAACWAGCGAA